MTVYMTSPVRYFEAIGARLLGKSNEHIDGSPLYADEYCGSVFPDIKVEIGPEVEKSYDHRDVVAVQFIHEGREFFFLKHEVVGKYEPIHVTIH